MSGQVGESERTEAALGDGLRQLFKARSPAERCDLCGEEVEESHAHLVEPRSHRLACSCRACSLLFSRQADTPYLLVPDEVWSLPQFELPEELWADLLIPVDMAFFFRSSEARRTVALYPSPAGATESQLTLRAWQTLESLNPSLLQMRADVEGLLVNRIGPSHRHFIAPIDRCYQLVGLMRAHWRGLSGGTEVWHFIGEFFDDLEARSRPWSGDRG